MTYVKKQSAVEAFQWTGGPDQKEDPDWIVDMFAKGTAWVTKEPDLLHEGRLDIRLNIKTVGVLLTARPGDYIIRDVRGTVYPCPADTFTNTHVPIEQTDFALATKLYTALTALSTRAHGQNYDFNADPDNVTLLEANACNAYSQRLRQELAADTSSRQ
jgi:hypothetical protein